MILNVFYISNKLVSNGRNSADIGIHEGLTAQDTDNSHTKAPFVNNSCVLSAVEDMDVLKHYVQVLKEFPQQPHFIPLQQYPEAILKGMKLGRHLMYAWEE